MANVVWVLAAIVVWLVLLGLGHAWAEQECARCGHVADEHRGWTGGSACRHLGWSYCTCMGFRSKRVVRVTN